MTEPLQLIRAEISLQDLHRWMGIRRLQDPDHAMHCLLVESFGPDLAPKPFRLMTTRGGRLACLYGYALAHADELRDAAAIYADPQQSRALPPERIDSKPMPAQWTDGKRLGFETRVRPIVRRSVRAAHSPGREWDAYQLEAERYPKGEMPYTREQVYANWLAHRFDAHGGAALESARLHSFQRTRATRRLRAGYCEGPDALLRGTLTITDGPAFAKLLQRGIGRHRAYGYGMLLLRPAG